MNNLKKTTNEHETNVHSTNNFKTNHYHDDTDDTKVIVENVVDFSRGIAIFIICISILIIIVIVSIDKGIDINSDKIVPLSFVGGIALLCSIFIKLTNGKK